MTIWRKRLQIRSGRSSPTKELTNNNLVKEFFEYVFIIVKFEVVTAVTMKNRVFRDVTP
jgi:hypothetical protein